MRVLHNRKPADHFSGREYVPAYRTDNMLETEPMTMRVVLLSAGKLSQTDREHLHQPALDPAVERRVPLDARHDHHGVSRKRGGIDEHLDLIAGAAERDDVAAGDDRAACRVLSDPESRDYVRLTRRRRRAMASHRGNDERLEPVANPVLDDAADDGRDIGDASTAHADGDSPAWANACRKAAALELASGFGTDVIREAVVGKVLPHEQ